MSGDHHVNYLASKESFGKTVMSWVWTYDHKRIGVMYLCAVLLMFFLGGLFAIALRAELWEPTQTVMVDTETGAVLGPAGEVAGGPGIAERKVGQVFPDITVEVSTLNQETGQREVSEKVITGNNIYNRMFSLHGTIMVFLFIIPSVPAALGNIFLPIMLGAKDVAFPKLNLFSWYIYVFGGIFALWALLQGGVETGWTSSFRPVPSARVICRSSTARAAGSPS